MAMAPDEILSPATPLSWLESVSQSDAIRERLGQIQEDAETSGMVIAMQTPPEKKSSAAQEDRQKMRLPEDILHVDYLA